MNWLTELFGEETRTAEEIAASLDAALVEERARIAAYKAECEAEKAAKEAYKAANRCPRCFGQGYLPQFAHRKAGECFACGGSGVRCNA